MRARAGEIEHADRLVRQCAPRDVAHRPLDRRDLHVDRERDVMVRGEPFGGRREDRARLLDRRLVEENRREPARQLRVLLDDAAVVVGRGGADAVELALREREAEIGAGFVVDLPREELMHLVEGEDDASGLRGDLARDLAPRRSATAPRTGAPASSSATEISTSKRASVEPAGAAASADAMPRSVEDFPTPGAPRSTGLFAWRLASTSRQRSIASSRPTTGASSPRAARSVRFFPMDDRTGKRFGSRTKRASSCGVRAARGAGFVVERGAGDATGIARTLGACGSGGGGGCEPLVRGFGTRLTATAEAGRCAGRGGGAAFGGGATSGTTRLGETAPTAICIVAFRSRPTSAPQRSISAYAAAVRSPRIARSR